jgi:hypothetical protein
MVRNMSLRDSISSMGADPTHDATTIAEEFTIQSGQSATGKGELGRAVMGEERISMLQECDKDKPMVDPTKKVLTTVVVR